MQLQFGGRNGLMARYARGLLLSLSLGLVGVATPCIAAQRVIIRLGPFEQSVEVADLEKYAKTGKLPQKLEILSSVLSPEVQQLLSRRLQVDPAIADKFIDDLVRSPEGKQLISSLGVAIPGSTVQTLQASFSLALRQYNGISALSFLRAYPQENITVDATSALAIAMEFSANRLQSQALGVLLSRELAVNNDIPFRAAFDPAAPGKQRVQQETLTFRDKQRNRIIPVDIYWSRRGEVNSPLVVISHGFGSSRRFSEYLARHLASYGITVAAIEHPGSNVTSVYNASSTGNLASLMPAEEFIDRPKDITFLLNELAKLNTQPGQLERKLNTETVTVIGHSLGGYTALALVGGELNLGDLRQFCKNSLTIGESPGDLLQCAAAPLGDKKIQLKDERVKSAIALNPLIGKIFGKNGLNKITSPVLILSGTEDSLTPALNHQIEPFTHLRGDKYLLTAIGGTHLSVSDPGYVGSAATTIVKERRGSETESLRQLTCGVSLAFIKQFTPEARIYQPFLTPAYAQSFSTPQLPLRLVRELPESIKPWLKFVVK